YPSSVLKPPSPRADSDAVVERPAGTELLAFEGEVALIIGKPARSVSLDRAWEHVGYVTAANDIGLYDYRAQDKGSNPRSKSRDGYTPIGPELIDAQSIDHKALRLRTWVNGGVVQDDGNSDEELMCPPGQIVAEL